MSTSRPEPSFRTEQPASSEVYTGSAGKNSRSAAAGGPGLFRLIENY
eukprot:COSAG01_NODE_2470_length_7633_cov_17.854468_7_plen_47_part_00